MAPYNPSFDGSNSSRLRSERRNVDDAQSKHEEVLFSLTERLRKSEAEVGLLRQENSELQSQLRLRGNPIKLDVAYDDLLTHLNQREASFNAESKTRAEQQRNLETEIRKLKDQAHLSRKLLDDQEKHISLMEKEAFDQLKHVSSKQKETKSELTKLQQQLDSTLHDNDEKHLEIIELKIEVQNLLDEIEHGKQREMEDREMLARLVERVDSHVRDQDELERMNEELQSRIEMQRHFLHEKENEFADVERTRDERENLLSDDLDRMNHRLNEILKTQHKIMQEKEEKIHLLYQQIDRYESILDEADYVTHEQRSALLENKREIELLSTAIDKVQNSGFLSQLEKIMACGKNSDYIY